MIKRFWLLGSDDDVATVGRRLAATLGVHLVERESSYLGGAYLGGSGSGLDEVIVQDNFEDEEGYSAEMDFPNYRTLIYVTQELESRCLPKMVDIGVHVLRVEEL